MVDTKRLGVGVVVVAVVAAAAASLWWTHREGRAYRGLASQYPANVALFAEMRQLGQWMPGQEGAQGQPARTDARRGTDPMLQVLSQVWAAEPPVKSADLPAILRDRPMAMGLWRVGDTYHGVAILPLAPGQKALLLDAVKGKLGEGPVVATEAGIPLRKLALPEDVKTADAVWGVSDQWAVMALSAGDVGEVFQRRDKSLADDPEFTAAVRRFPQDRGAYLFLRGSDLASLVKDRAHAERSSASEGAPAQPAAPGAPEAPKPPAPPKAPLASPPPEPVTPPAPPPGEAAGSEGQALHALRALGEEGLMKAAPLDNIGSMSLWTAPPTSDQKGWETEAWMAFKGEPRGLWRLVAEGAPRTEQIASRVPKNGLVYVWGAGKDPARIYQTFLEELQKIATPDQMGWVRAGIGAAEGKLGLSFSNDLLPTIADEWCFVSSRDPVSKRGSAGFFMTLRDPRRFEDIVANKLAPQFGLKPANQPGARVWTWGGWQGKGEGVDLVVSGGMAIVTSDPSWALATGGDAGKAWKAFSAYRDKASGLLIMDPTRWAKSNDVLVVGAYRCSSAGVDVDARFPGEPPSWGRACSEGGKASGAGKGPLTSASGGESPGPGASVSP